MGSGGFRGGVADGAGADSFTVDVEVLVGGGEHGG